MNITITAPYLNLPIRRDAALSRWMLLDKGRLIQFFTAQAGSEDNHDFYSFIFVPHLVGRTLELRVDGEEVPENPPALLRLTDSPIGLDNLYREVLRPQFHFSTCRGWLNDPNGLVYHNGRYHLFYQHNPFSLQSPWSGQHWGHAVSRDLVHWQERGDALFPGSAGAAYSGSAVVAAQDTGGSAGAESDSAIQILYTAEGRHAPAPAPTTQRLARSTDSGITWTEPQENPVVPQIVAGNRDPKVFWHEPTQSWIMVLYLQKTGDEHVFGLLGSADLLSWQQVSEIRMPGKGECPDLFALPVDNDPENVHWVFWTADGHYLVGDFDGRNFHPRTGPLNAYGSDTAVNAYAAQTFSNIPQEDGRCIQIAWLRGDFPGMPFSQQMTFPTSMHLRTTPDGVRLCSEPVREIRLLHGSSRSWDELAPEQANQVISSISGQLLHVRTELEFAAGGRLGLRVRDLSMVYDLDHAEFVCAMPTGDEVRIPLVISDRRVFLEILVDRASVEIFVDHGRVYLPLSVSAPAMDSGMAVIGNSATGSLKRLEVHELRSVW